MNKKQLAKVIVAENSYAISEKCATEMINTFMNTVKNEVAKGNVVKLTDFGSFDSVARKERTYKDLATKETKTMPARITPRFKPSTAFKDIVK